jgi:predicted nucleotidyltransferase
MVPQARHPFLRSEAGARALALLSSKPGEELHTNEIIRRTGTNARAMQKALVALSEGGLLESRRLGNLRLWKIAQSSPLYPALRDLFGRTRGIPAAVQDVLRHDPHIKFAFLFGSYVTAQDDPTSDIDLFVVTNGRLDWEKLSLTINEVGRQVRRELRPVVWAIADLKRPTDGQREFLANVLAAPKIWLVGSEDEFQPSARSMGPKVVRQRAARASVRPGRARTSGPRKTKRLTRTKTDRGRRS